MSAGIGDLLKELDIVEVISSYIDLKRSGSNYKANCPFHPDDTPSLFVSPQKGIWKCFGCGVGGDFIKFVALYENLSYTQAALEIAKKYGIRLKISGSSSDNSKVLEAMAVVSEIYERNLSKNRDAVEYLRGRGTDPYVIKKFKIGFAENSNEIVEKLKEMGLLEYYERTGNLIKSDEFYRDMFRNRIVIPIRDERGNIVAFGGRSIKGETPKYINSPESEIFKKSRILFGFYEGKEYIRETETVVITEGYFDVLSLFQKGVRFAVAPMGTALTEDHAKLLSRYAKRAVLMFDGDQAGRKAERMAIPVLLKEGMEVRVFRLPEGEDADSFSKKVEGKDLKEKLMNAPEIFEHLINLISEGDKDALRDFLYYVAFVNDSVKAYDMLLTVSKITGIPVTSLSEQVYIKPKEEERDRVYLSHAERIFLKGLMELKPEKIDLNSLNLSPDAMIIAESILKEEYYNVPRDIINMKVYNLHEAFNHVVEKFLKSYPVPEDLPDDFEDRKRKLREMAYAESNRFRSFFIDQKKL